jgi:hypothetical protein
MSCANILGNGAYSGTVGADDLFKATGTVALAIGAGPVASPAVSLPFLKSTDQIVLAYSSGGTVVGPLSAVVANSGLANASFTVESAGAVAVAPVNILYMVFAGRN